VLIDGLDQALLEIAHLGPRRVERSVREPKRPCAQRLALHGGPVADPLAKWRVRLLPRVHREIDGEQVEAIARGHGKCCQISVWVTQALQDDLTA
jgi:hypothetical protein